MKEELSWYLHIRHLGGRLGASDAGKKKPLGLSGTSLYSFGCLTRDANGLAGGGRKLALTGHATQLLLQRIYNVYANGKIVSSLLLIVFIQPISFSFTMLTSNYINYMLLLLAYNNFFFLNYFLCFQSYKFDY